MMSYDVDDSLVENWDWQNTLLATGRWEISNGCCFLLGPWIHQFIGSEWSDQKLYELHLYCIFSNKQAIQKLFFWCILMHRCPFPTESWLVDIEGLGFKPFLNHHGTWWDLWPLGGSGIAPHRRAGNARQRWQWWISQFVASAFIKWYRSSMFIHVHLGNIIAVYHWGPLYNISG